MAERRPPGFNVDLGFYDSDEVLSIPRKIRAAAIGVWTLCGAYSANKLTDGYVSAEALKDRGCTPAIRAALMSTTPIPLWESVDVGAIRFTRWAKWQRTSGEVKAYREADAERKRKAREAKKGAAASDDSEMSDRTSRGQPQDVRADSGTPKTETETETKKEHFGYVPESASLSTARDAQAATPGADLVRELIPSTIPDSERTMLRIKASSLLREGSTREDVGEGLRLYLAKPHLGAGALPALVSEAIRSRSAPPNGKTHKLRTLAELEQETRAQENAQLETFRATRELT